MSNIKRFFLNRVYILKKAWQIDGVIFGLFGLVGMLAPTDQILPTRWMLCIRCALSILVLFSIFVFTCILMFVWMKNHDKVQILRVQNGKHLFVQYGDIFDKSVTNDKWGKTSANKRNIIIPVNCCFDTIVDDDMIAKGKIHGKAVENLLTQMSLEELDRKISDSLKGKNYVEIDKDKKRKGNLKRYPFGTIVELDSIDDSKYFLVALTEFNDQLHAEIHNRENYLITIQKMIEYIEARSQGLPVVIPVIGGGLSEVSTSEQIILDTLIQIYKLNKDKINCDIHLVVRDECKDSIRIHG